MSAAYPVIAVVDKQGEERTVVWQVQTSPDGPAASGMLSGAWIFGPGEVDPARLADLLRGALVLPVGATAAGEHPATSLSQISTGIAAAVAEIKEAAKAAKAENKNLQLPRLDVVSEPDPVEIAENYHGEESARQAWATATALGGLVEQWHTIEGQRRSRKYLQEAFGAEIRALPVA